mgnify:CR=1 FL=1
MLDNLNRHFNQKKHIHFALFLFIILAGFMLLDFGFAESKTNATRMTIFIKNTAPVIVWANVTSNPTLPGSYITIRGNASDANGDSLMFNVSIYNTTKGLIARRKMSYHPTEKIWVNNTYQLPADARPGNWYANITFYDGFTFVVNKTRFEVSSQTSTKLQNSPIDFGNQTVGQIAQRADNGTAVAGKYSTAIRGWPLILNNTGNTLVNYTLNGSDLKGPTKTIGVGNVTWNITSNPVDGEGVATGKIKLTAAQKLVATGKAAKSYQKVYFWITTPNGITQQRLNGTVVIITSTE